VPVVYALSKITRRRFVVISKYGNYFAVDHKYNFQSFSLPENIPNLFATYSDNLIEL